MFDTILRNIDCISVITIYEYIGIKERENFN